jgi:hypothetical protein
MCGQDRNLRFKTRSDLPGRSATDQQMRLYMELRCHHRQRVAAAKIGVSGRTVRRIEADPRLPSPAVQQPLHRAFGDRHGDRLLAPPGRRIIDDDIGLSAYVKSRPLCSASVRFAA